MKWVAVESSNISAVAYEGDTLFVRFARGDVYKYFGVPQDVYDALCIAPSVGGFLASKIKGKYTYEKVPRDG